MKVGEIDGTMEIKRDGDSSLEEPCIHVILCNILNELPQG